VGKAAPQRQRGLQSVVLAPRGHLDVNHGHVRAVRERPAQEIIGIAGLGHDVEPGLGEQPRDAFAQKHVVLPDHHPERLVHGPTVLQRGPSVSDEHPS
jgi:hypothetical protein